LKRPVNRGGFRLPSPPESIRSSAGTEYEDWTFGNGVAQMLEIAQGKERAAHGASVDSF
jgi:hypothetical protein